LELITFKKCHFLDNLGVPTIGFNDELNFNLYGLLALVEHPVLISTGILCETLVDTGAVKALNCQPIIEFTEFLQTLLALDF
jgi:hypothetical protein